MSKSWRWVKLSKPNLLEVDVNAEGTSDDIIGFLESTIKGLKGYKGKFKMELKIRQETAA